PCQCGSSTANQSGAVALPSPISVLFSAARVTWSASRQAPSVVMAWMQRAPAGRGISSREPMPFCITISEVSCCRWGSSGSSARAVSVALTVTSRVLIGSPAQHGRVMVTGAWPGRSRVRLIWLAGLCGIACRAMPASSRRAAARVPMLPTPSRCQGDTSGQDGLVDDALVLPRTFQAVAGAMEHQLGIKLVVLAGMADGDAHAHLQEAAGGFIGDRKSVV